MGIAIVVIGIVILAVPVIMEMWVAEQARENIVAIDNVYDSMSEDWKKESVSQAHLYNDHLMGRSLDTDAWPYDEQLRYNHEPSSMMSWLEIPKVNAKLPVYHHTSEAVLMAGVGHIDTTSLPVGGEGTLCALSGHSGMPNARMFDDIHYLDKGDVFVLWTLSEPYAYRVVSVDVVEPSDSQVIKPQAGRDLVALVTCTPINVNSHRLVVLGERCEYDPNDDAMKPTIASVASKRTIPLMIGLGVVVLFVVFLFVRARCRGRHAEA